MAELNLDLSNVAPTPPPLPPGEYLAFVDKSDANVTKNGKGHIVKLEFQILAGEQKGRRFFDNIIVAHESKQAEEIGLARLRSLCDALGIAPKIRDTAVLQNRKVLVKLGKSKDGSTEVKGYESPKEGEPAAEGAEQPATASPNGGSAPWANRPK